MRLALRHVGRFTVPQTDHLINMAAPSQQGHDSRCGQRRASYNFHTQNGVCLAENLLEGHYAPRTRGAWGGGWPAVPTKISGTYCP